MVKPVTKKLLKNPNQFKNYNIYNNIIKWRIEAELVNGQTIISI